MNSTAHAPRRHTRRFVSFQLVVLLFAALATTGFAPATITTSTPGVIQIAASYFHTCALLSSGGLMCWGYNSNGQLGDNTTISHSTPVAVRGLTNLASAVAVGDRHSCALFKDGHISCWGANNTGQVGDGTIIDKTTPVAVKGLAGPATMIGTGDNHTCALLEDSSVECWGANNVGQLGDGTIFVRQQCVMLVGLRHFLLLIHG